MFSWILLSGFLATAEAPEPISRKIRQTTFSWLENKNVTFQHRIPESPYFGPDFDGTKFSAKNRFTIWAMLYVNFP